jgi:hypothetical protein
VTLRLLAWWRHVFVYRRHWQPVLVIAGLAESYQERRYLPRIRRVVCDTWADRVKVTLVAGTSPADFETRVSSNHRFLPHRGQRRGVSDEMEPIITSPDDAIETPSRATPEGTLLATPAPSARSETPQDPEHQYLWRCFPDHVWSQRVRDTSFWVWSFGYDVPDLKSSRWVCKRCIQNKSPRPRSFTEKGIQNANAHLFNGHGIWAPGEAIKSAAQKKAEKMKTKD